MLRELVKKQKLQLSEKDEIIRRQQIQIENMTQALLHARKKMFGRSSEVSTGYEQLCLFEETTELAKALLKEQETISVKEHKRAPRKPGIRKEMLAGLPKEIEEYIIDAEEKCSVCGGELKVIGKEIVRTEVEFKPATLIVKQIVRQIATARRAWLFTDTPNGARANAVLYTLVESARANDLNVYAYLDYLLAKMPNADFYNHPEIIDDMLPWSDKLPESCCLTHKHKKNFKK